MNGLVASGGGGGGAESHFTNGNERFSFGALKDDEKSFGVSGIVITLIIFLFKPVLPCTKLITVSRRRATTFHL